MVSRRVKRNVALIFIGAVVGVAPTCMQSVLENAGISYVVTEGDGALGRDAAYQGSLTLAGLAVFGSALMTRFSSLTRSSPRDVRIGFGVLLIATFSLAGTHIYFAALMCCNEPGPYLAWLGVLSMSFIGLAVLGFLHAMTARTNWKSQIRTGLCR